jgi:DnaJ-class molecular chaperone
MNQRPYEILGVSSTASQEEIKNAYRKLAKQFHPDLNPGNKAAEKRFKEISAAYELVGTPESRAKFDRGEYDEEVRARPGEGRAGAERGPFYHQTQAGGGRYSFSFGGIDEDILQSIFGRMGRGGEGFAADQPGEDELYRMEIEFRDAVLGGEKEITLPSGRRIRVKIPAGVDTGARLRFAGIGSPGRGKGPPGDVYVELDVRPSHLFRRLGHDLELDLPISVSEALLGGEVRVPTVDGAILLKIPPAVSSGTRLRMAGKGVPQPGGRRGDQYAVLKIMVPPEIDADFKQAVEAWSKRQHFDPRAGWAGARGGTT